MSVLTEEDIEEHLREVCALPKNKKDKVDGEYFYNLAYRFWYEFIDDETREAEDRERNREL